MKSFSITDIGIKRNVNQDFMYRSDTEIGDFPNLYIVADGMGGHKAGEHASRLAIETICDMIQSTPLDSPSQLLGRAVKKANEVIVKAGEGNEDLKGMGTTVVAASIFGEELHFVNVGDSRLYVVNESIKQLSKDHSLVEEMVRLGGIKPEEAKNHPDKNIITRALGAKSDVEVDRFEHKLKENDVIVICSDGLTNLVEDSEIFVVVKSSRDLVEAGHKLVDMANERGGTDNITVVLIEPMGSEVSI